MKRITSVLLAAALLALPSLAWAGPSAGAHLYGRAGTQHRTPTYVGRNAAPRPMTAHQDVIAGRVVLVWSAH
ncbi:MAG: hypothetical protein IT443_04810 [Phycisphaeraceae bacterium]|nr:hypothetical protein [Phycisphaeraceae bacterium]